MSAPYATLATGTHRLRCWKCGRNERDKTMGVTVGGGRVVWHCFRCQVAGAQRSDRPLGRPGAMSAPMPVPKREWSGRANAIWRSTTGLRGTLGEEYLRQRGCVMPPSDSHLRFLGASNRYPPTLCAAITDALTGNLLSLHFTRLAADGHGKAGTDRDKLLLKGHRKVGGVVRLWPDEAVTTSLAVAEGIETALAAAHVHRPVWSCIDSGNLTIFPLLPGIECLSIVADHDEAGIRAADRCGVRWEDMGREVSVVVPGSAGMDMADVAVDV